MASHVASPLTSGELWVNTHLLPAPAFLSLGRTPWHLAESSAALGPQTSGLPHPHSMSHVGAGRGRSSDAGGTRPERGKQEPARLRARTPALVCRAAHQQALRQAVWAASRTQGARQKGQAPGDPELDAGLCKPGRGCAPKTKHRAPRPWTPSLQSGETGVSVVYRLLSRALAGKPGLTRQQPCFPSVGCWKPKPRGTQSGSLWPTQAPGPSWGHAPGGRGRGVAKQVETLLPNGVLTGQESPGKILTIHGKNGSG